MKKNIIVAGLGLIGGSLAMSIKQSSDNHVIGYDTNIDSVDYAFQQEIISEKCFDLTTCAPDADLIILEASISQTISLLKDLDTISFNTDVVITDVSSLILYINIEAIILSYYQFNYIVDHLYNVSNVSQYE